MHAGLTHSYLLIHPLMFNNAHYRPTASKHTYMPWQCTHFIRTPVQRQLSSLEQHKYRCRSFTHYTLIAQVESTHIYSLIFRGILTPKSHINVLIIIDPRTPKVDINSLLSSFHSILTIYAFHTHSCLISTQFIWMKEKCRRYLMNLSFALI